MKVFSISVEEPASDLSELVIRARAGDADAFGALVGKFQGMAVGYVFSLLDDFGLTEDGAQEAFFQADKDPENGSSSGTCPTGIMPTAIVPTGSRSFGK